MNPAGDFERSINKLWVVAETSAAGQRSAKVMANALWAGFQRSVGHQHLPRRKAAARSAGNTFQSTVPPSCVRTTSLPIGELLLASLRSSPYRLTSLCPIRTLCRFPTSTNVLVQEVIENPKALCDLLGLGQTGARSNWMLIWEFERISGQRHETRNDPEWGQEENMVTLGTIFLSEMVGSAVLILLGAGVVANNLLPRNKGAEPVGS